jgi:hypothetical protein
MSPFIEFYRASLDVVFDLAARPAVVVLRGVYILCTNVENVIIFTAKIGLQGREFDKSF